MYIIKNRNGEQVNEITLKPAEWCTFIGSKGGEYIITNAYGRMSVSKPGTIDEIKATKEIRNAPIYIVAPGEEKITPAPTQKEATSETIPAQADTIEVTTYVINEGTSSQYYGLKTIEDNQVLTFAPNNWKTEKGALNWAKNHGCTVAAPMPKPAQEETPVEAEPKEVKLQGIHDKQKAKAL